MKRRVMIFEPYPFPQESGNFRTLRNIIQYINSDAFDLFLIVPFMSEFVDKAKRFGCRSLLVKAPNLLLQYGGKIFKLGIAKKLLLLLQLLKYNYKIYKILDRYNIDMIYCNCTRSVMMVGLAALLAKRPIFWYVKGELQNPVLDWIAFHIATGIAFISRSNVTDKYPALIRRFSMKIHVVPHGLNEQLISSAVSCDKSAIAADIGYDDNLFNIIFMGQLCPGKGVHFLIEAVSLVIKKHKNIHLYILGDPIISEWNEYENHLIKMVEELNVTPYVSFLGWRSDALEILSLMDILVHPSLSEGLPTVVMEAMAMGKAIIATKVGGARDLIADGIHGFLVPREDSLAISERLCSLIENDSMRREFGEAACARFKTNYGMEKVIGKLENVWYWMCKRRSDRTG